MKVDDELLTIFQNYLPGYYQEFQPYQFVFYVLAQPYLIKLPSSNQAISFMMIGKAPVAYIPFQELDQLGFWLNIIMTCPLGIFTYILFSPKFKISHVITTGILIGFTIEFIQFITDNLAITYRWVDINDVLANTLGFVVGYYLSKLIDK